MSLYLLESRFSLLLRHKDSMERFQHSSQTINHHIRRVMKVLVSLAGEFIQKPDFTRIPQQILNDPSFYPYFKGCVGAIDGTLIPAWVPINRQNAYRSRKSTVSQNVLAVCDMDMQFNYVVAGWEGSASDAYVLSNTIRWDDSFPWCPEGRYYLVDAGYTNYGPFLAPYRNTCYHLLEWNAVGAQARNPQEMFNHRHARLRNVIERAFGVLKSRFPILRHGMPSYKIKHQIQMVIACCVVHNFVRRRALPDPLFEMVHPHYDTDNLVFSQKSQPDSDQIEEQAAMRDAMAQAMWDNRHQ